MSESVQGPRQERELGNFRKKFENSSTKSIDLFMARNPNLAPIGKYIIAFEIFSAEERSQFRERAEWVQEAYKHRRDETTLERYLQRKDFQGGDWYSYLFDRLTAGLVGKDDLPDFSEGKVTFITFNYDRSLEYFLYESLRNSFTQVPEAQVVECLKSLKILHIYGQITPLKWQDSNEGVDYRPPISESLLYSASQNIRTIYEEKQNQQLTEAQDVLSQAEQILFLGFGYAPENMEVLGLHGVIPPSCQVYGTAFGMMDKEIADILHTIRSGRRADSDGHKERYDTLIYPCDCLELLRKQL
jgi:hypothetical protein